MKYVQKTLMVDNPPPVAAGLRPPKKGNDPKTIALIMRSYAQARGPPSPEPQQDGVIYVVYGLRFFKMSLCHCVFPHFVHPRRITAQSLVRRRLAPRGFGGRSARPRHQVSTRGAK